MQTASERGETREVTLDQGRLRWAERGTGAPIVFVHGALVNGDLWRKVVPRLAGRSRCLTPDWPLGSHSVPMNPDADLSPPGLARLVADFIAALDLDDVTLVGNDTGGALCQLVVTAHPERIARLVLTPCDAFDNFPPRIFRYLVWAARVPGGLFALAQTMRLRPVCRLPLAYGWLARHGIDDQTLESYVRPLVSDARVRHDLAKVLLGISPAHTRAAAERLGGFRGPVLIAWPPENPFFPFAHARRLAAAFPNARLEPVPDAYTFVSEDQPERLSDLIAGFVQEAAMHTA
jgi:pimeloyl-ACP methyl ester carboxylesterase